MNEEALLFELNPIPMLIYDLDSLQILKVNKAAVEKYGYSENEFEQLTVEEIRPEEDIEKLHNILDDLKEGINSSRVIRHKTKDGAIFYAQIRSHSFPYQSYNARMVSVVDISEEVQARMDAEKAYRELDHLVKQNPLAMIKWDDQLRVVEWSGSISGFSREEMVGKSLFEMELFTPEVRDFFKKRIHEIKKGGSVKQRDTYIENKAGEKIDIRIHTSVLRDDDGVPITLLTFVEDISRTKKVERSLFRQNRISSFVNELSQQLGDLEEYDEALQLVIDKICDFLDCPVGHAFKVIEENRLVSANIWHTEDPGYQPLVERSQRIDFVPGKGFWGTLIEQNEPCWISDIHRDSTFNRQPANPDFTLRRHITVPVKVGKDVEVLLEFFGEQADDPEPGYIKMLESVKSLLSQILQRIRARDELKLNERKYRRLFERSGDGILILKGNEIEDCNTRIEELFECRREDVIGETPFKFSPPRQPDGQRSELKGQQLLRKTVNGAPQVFEWKHQTASGRLIDTEINLNKIKLQDGAYVQAIIRDITDQKEAERALKRSEELFRNLFLRAPVAMVMVNQENKVQMVNRTFEELFGYTEEELLDKDVDRFIVPEDDYETAPKMPGEEFFKEDFIEEFTRKTKDERKIDVLVGAIPVYLEGEPLAGFGIYIDISDQKNAQRKLEGSLKEKEILLKEVHHRVKNNLAVISALLELQVFNEENEKLNAIMSDSLLRIKTMALVHETLYQTGDFANLEFHNYLGKLIELNSKAAETREQDIAIEYEVEEIDLNINQAIPAALILNELVSNALKYAFEQREEGQLTIRLQQHNNHLHLLVEDNGVGLPENFEELRQESMGMTLIDQLTEQLRGDLKIESNGGTRFELVFKKERGPGSSSHYFT